MDESIKELILIIDKFKLNFLYGRPFQNNLQNELKVLKDSLTKFKNSILSSSLLDHTNFIQKHIADLYSIHDVAAGQFARLHLTLNQRTSLRSNYDNIINTLKLTNVIRHFLYLPTYIFTEFAKGYNC